MLALVLGLFAGCGGDDDEKSDDAFEASGELFSAASGSSSLELSFSSGEAGAKYFILPFVVGATSGAAAVQGASFSNPVGMDVSSTGSSSMQAAGLSLAPQKAQKVMTGREFDLALRSLVNRFDKNNPEHWKALQDLDEVEVTSGIYSSQQYALHNGGKHLVEAFERSVVASEQRLLKKQARKLVDTTKAELVSNCPPQNELSTVGYSGEVMEASKVPLKHDSADFCLYVHTSGLVTETDVERIKASISKALSLYKDVIYQDSMSKTRDSYKFQPLFFILPYGDSTYWKDGSPSVKFSGAFDSGKSLENDRPSLYIAADQSVIAGETDSSKNNETFHATIAHELQHAVLHYYRYTANIDTLDDAQFDEGLAHHMEDMLGYGEASFDEFAGAYLGGFSSGVNALLPTGTVLSSINRGAAQVLFHYLTSQKGGVTFDDTLDGGDGLGYIRSYVKGTTQNIQGLTAAYGDDWMATIGKLFGAVSVDGASTVIEGDSHKVQMLTDEVTDTVGGEEKNYGMRFHRYRSLPDLNESLESFTAITSGPHLSTENIPKPWFY